MDKAVKTKVNKIFGLYLTESLNELTNDDTKKAFTLTYKFKDVLFELFSEIIKVFTEINYKEIESGSYKTLADLIMSYTDAEEIIDLFNHICNITIMQSVDDQDERKIIKSIITNQFSKAGLDIKDKRTSKIIRAIADTINLLFGHIANRIAKIIYFAPTKIKIDYPILQSIIAMELMNIENVESLLSID